MTDYLVDGRPLKPGMLTTVQDLGRRGYQGLGVPVSGPMDAYSHRLANRLLGNHPMAAALEITLLGPELIADGDLTCAIAGAEIDVTVDGVSVPRHQPFRVPSGSRLRCGARGKGTRLTLAVRGGFDVPATLGSRSTHLVSRMGPFGGRALRAGDILPVGSQGLSAEALAKADSRRFSVLPLELPEGGAQVRVVPAAHRERFTDDAWGLLVRARFTVSPQSNRMGYRLDGPVLGHVGAADILSEAMPIGAIQVPASGQPILLMAERQTTGGYATIANVITADLPIAGQLAPGDWIAFSPVTREEAPLVAARARGGAGRRGALSGRDFGALLAGQIPADRVQRDAPLAPFTTFKVGGPADWLVQAQRANEVKAALGAARAAGLPVTVLGGGSNALVSDAGVRGLVIRIHGGDVRPAGEHTVRADGGLTINGLVRWTIGRGVAGLEAWAGTPGTVGGAIYGNAHFKGRLISELVESVEVVDTGGGTGHEVRIAAADMEFGYDRSRLQRTRELVLSADFRVGRGEPAALRAVARESLAYRKRTQPLESASAGCIFQNPDPAVDRVPAGIPASAGALVDRAGLKGSREGGAGVAHAREFHRQRRRGVGRRHPSPDRALPRTGPRAVRRRAARRDCVPGVLGPVRGNS